MTPDISKEKLEDVLRFHGYDCIPLSSFISMDAEYTNWLRGQYSDKKSEMMLHFLDNPNEADEFVSGWFKAGELPFLFIKKSYYTFLEYQLISMMSGIDLRMFID